MSPDWSRRAAFTRSCASAQSGVNSNLSLIGLGLTIRNQRVRRIARQNVEARHGLSEGLSAKERTGRRSGGYSTVICIGTLDEGVQAVYRRECPSRRDQSPFQEVTTGNLTA